MYLFNGYRSGDDFKNYSFSLADPGIVDDGVHEARYYFSTPVADDIAAANQKPGIHGRWQLRLHRGNLRDRPGSGSAGCLVSPYFCDLRDLLIELYQAEFEAIHPGKRDDEVSKVYHNDGQQLWNNTETNAANSVKLTAENWNSKIVGELWVIRPDERPKG